MCNKIKSNPRPTIIFGMVSLASYFKQHIIVLVSEPAQIFLDTAKRGFGFSEVAEAATTNPKQQMGEFVAIEKYDEAFEFEVPLCLLNSQEKASMPC